MLSFDTLQRYLCMPHRSASLRFICLIIAKAVASKLDRRGVVKVRKTFNYHNIVMSSQNDQTGSVVVQQSEKN